MHRSIHSALLVVAVSASLATALPAQAAPTPSPSPARTAATPTPAPSQTTVTPKSTSSGTTTYSFYTSGNLGEKIDVTSKMWQHGGQKQGHLDWAAAKKYFGAHTTWRDDFAAGAQAGGATLDNAAASTKSRLKARWDAMTADAARNTPEVGLNGGGTNCTGTSKSVKWNGTRSENWFDSCDTNTLVQHWGYCTAAMAFATFAAPGYWSAVPIIFGLICGQKAAAILTAQKNSNVSAIKYYNYRVERSNSGPFAGQYYISATLYSQ